MKSEVFFYYFDKLHHHELFSFFVLFMFLVQCSVVFSLCHRIFCFNDSGKREMQDKIIWNLIANFLSAFLISFFPWKKVLWLYISTCRSYWNPQHNFLLLHKRNEKKEKNHEHYKIFKGSIVCFGLGFMVSELMNAMILKEERR